jgi:hypothetical protein
MIDLHVICKAEIIKLTTPPRMRAVPVLCFWIGLATRESATTNVSPMTFRQARASAKWMGEAEAEVA